VPRANITRAQHVLQRVLLSLIAPATILAACNAISGLDQDYELTEGSSGSTSSSGGDGQATDGGPIEEATDGEVTPDGPKPDVDGAPPPVDCNGAVVPGALFCWNFDKGDGLGGGWTQETVSGSANLELAPGNAGAGQALRARVDGNGNSSAKAALIRTISTKSWASGQTLTLKLNLKIVTASTDYAAFGVFEFGTPPPTEHGLAFYSGGAQCPGGVPCLDENEPVHRPDHTMDLTGATPLAARINKWMPAEVSLTWTSGGGGNFAGKVKVDGLTLDDRATNAMPSTAAPPQSVVLRVGVFFAGAAAQPNEVFIDDIVVTLN
jgi:hypothetical protein